MIAAGNIGEQSLRRERLVSATVFAAVAALFGLVGLGMMTAPADLWRYETRALLLGPPVMAALAALVGWRAGPRLAQAPDGLAAAAIGLGITLAAVLLYIAAACAVVWTGDLVRGEELSGSWSAVPVGLFVIGAYTVVAAVVAGPFGALGAVLAWRRIRRAEPDSTL